MLCISQNCRSKIEDLNKIERGEKNKKVSGANNLSDLNCISWPESRLVCLSSERKHLCLPAQSNSSAHIVDDLNQTKTKEVTNSQIK